MTRPTPATAILASLATWLPLSAGLAAPLPVCPISNGQTVTYDILRGGSVFGHQTIRYAIAGPDMTVTLDVSAALHALGLRVYHYEHHGEERWHDGQMVGLVTRTDDDGVPRHVDASRDAQAGQWRGVTGLAPGPAPLLSTSLWNIQTVVQSRLLDRETGEVVAVRSTGPAAETVQLGTRQVTASRYESAGLVKGSIWYDTRGCMVQAVFHTRVDDSLIEIRAQ